MKAKNTPSDAHQIEKISIELAQIHAQLELILLAEMSETHTKIIYNAIAATRDAVERCNRNRALQNLG